MKMTTRSTFDPDMPRTLYYTLSYELFNQYYDRHIYQGLLTFIGDTDVRNIMMLNQNDINEMNYVKYKDETNKL